ncbi:two-partner secretion domain-containing protein [Moraxella lacunata]|nr:filamentous hemagglutinin N-terminal domain-containing protein [Moraxella lacunata]
MTSQQDSFGYGLYGKFKLASMAVLLGLTFSVTSYANPNTATTIIADPSAPENLQPTILPTASGIVSVNIATPNDKGLSNNHYSQFDVGSTGAVLNNNRKAVNTQIAGYVQANPFMAKGEASTILNQINSNNPSHLGGFIEVAGKRADVIIANPNGLVINGTGFINAGNVHLVAANGKFDQGQITGYQVNTGNIEVNGKLNLQNTDYAALIAKTAQINDEIYAGSVLDIVTGENTVTLQDGKFNQLSAAHKNDGASSTNQTGIALDVAALGGMYAGKIRLIGTDKGFGVNNQGMIAATGSGVQAGTGTLTLDHQGNLVNTGIASAKDKVTINTQSHHVRNAGTLLGEQSDIAIDTAKLTNTGTIASTQNTKITATNAIDNQGSMYGGVLQVSTDELTNTGKLVQTGTGKLTISTHTLTNTNKAAIGQSLYEKTQLKAPSVPSTDQSAGTVSHQPADNTTTNNSNNGANTPNPSTDTPSANGFISTTKSLNNTGDKALITATGDTHITANQTSNTNQASIDAQTLNTNTLANTDSKIALDNIHWQLTSFDNSKGDIISRQDMAIDSESTIINTAGSLTSGGDMVLVAKNEFNNSDGVVQSTGDVSVAASKVINNQGVIHGAHALTINANGTLKNNAGVISGAQNTTITAKTAIDNTDGRIQSDGKLNVNAQQLNSTGTIYAAQDTAITASHINNEQAGLIASAKDVRIDTQSLTSTGTISAGMQSDGKLGDTPANISIQATEGIRSNGNAIATGTLTLNANTINLDDSKTQADNITLLAQDTISTRKTSTVASNSLAITAPNKLDNSEGILSANEMIVNTDVLENRQGTISQAGKTALSLAIKRSINNTLGTISTNSDKLEIDTNQLINQQGAIHHAGVGELNVKSENLNNSQGELLSLGTQTLNIKAIDNSQGIISATGFTINAGGLDNTAGLLQATDKDADNLLNIDSTLDNNKLAEQQGSIDVAGNLALTAKALQNQGEITTNNLKATVANVNNTGAIGARGNIQIASSQDIDNTGNISATGNIVLNANNTISHQGVMMAAENITATANRLNFNQSTSSADNISLSAQADIHHNQGATVANNKLSLKNTSTIHNQGGVLSANHTSIDTKDLRNGGIIQADVLAIKQQADYTHTDNDKLLANSLQLSTDGKITNQSQLTANQDLTLVANHIDNTQTGTISSGNHTQITSQTSINNQGLINGETTVIKANDTINNQSGGRIYGTHLAIQADTLNNTPAKVKELDSKYTAPVIAARERLDIGVKMLNNNPNPDRAGKFNENFDNQALITSLGSLHIGGNLDDNHYATGKAGAVINKGATIESGGEMVVGTSVLKNENADFATKTQSSSENIAVYHANGRIYTPNEVSITPVGHNHRILPLIIKNSNNEEYRTYDRWNYKEILTWEETDVSDPSRIVSGGDLTVDIDQFNTNKSQVIAGGKITLTGKVGSIDPESTLIIPKYSYQDVVRTHHKPGTGCRQRVLGSCWGAYEVTDVFVDKNALQSINAKTAGTPYFLPIVNQNGGIKTAVVMQNVSADHLALNAANIDSSALVSGDIDTVLTTLQATQSALSATAQKQLSDLLSAKQSGQDVDEAVLANLVDELKHSITNKQAVTIANTDNTLTIPTSALYTINADNPNQPLIQTDSAFTNHKQWLGSDYMLKAMQSDPNHIHKRLSDGYGEQARIKDEYYLLTGRHINTDYHSNEEAFKQLMDNGIAHAKQFGYTLGTALTPDQMANLTTNIVWLVKQSITYTTKDKDGNSITKIEDVLVPKLYLRSANIAAGTLSPDGRYSAVSARNINMQLTGDLDNNGNLIAKDTAAITANNVNNTGIINGDFVKISTNNDLINHGTLHANSAMGLDAKNRIMSQSLTTTQTNTQGKSSSSRTDLSQIATISVGAGLKDSTDENGKPLTTLSLRGNQIIYQGATSDNTGGSTQMAAENGINIGTVTVSNHISAVADDNNYFKYSQSTDVGSNISSYGDTIIRTTGKNADINIQGSHLDSVTGTTAIIGTGGVRMTEGRKVEGVQSASSYQQDKWYGSKDIKQTYESYTDAAVLSTVLGNDVYIISQDADVSLFGTNVNANEQASISAKQGNVTVQSAVNSIYQNNTKTTQNFYKNTGNVDGFYQETLAQTGVRAGSVDIQGNSANLNGISLQATHGPITVGNAHLATNDDGTLKLNDNGKPTVISGDMHNLNLGTVDLTNETWQEISKSYRGLAKDVMKGVGVVTGALGFDGVTLAKSDSNHSKTEIQAVSELHGSHIQAGAQTVTATGTRFDAGTDGFVAVLGDDVLFATAKHTKTANATQTRQTITGEGMRLGKDHLQLGAVVHTDSTDTQSTQSTTHDGVTVRGNNAVVLGNMNDGSLTTQATNFDLDPTSGTLLIGAKSTLLDGAINQTAHTQSNETNTTRIGATVHHVAVDTAIAAENVKEAIQAANHARKELEQAKTMVKAGKLDPNAIKDYELNLAMATTNVANAQIALGSTAATAASTAPTLGFSAKLGATHTQSQSSQTQTNQEFVATNITAANTTLVGDDFTTKGLQGDIGNLNVDQLNKLTLTHATTQDISLNQSSGNTLDASISSTGNLSAGVSRQQSHSQSTSTTTHDTKLNLGELNGHANTTTLHGATITTQGGHYSTNTLNITTSQNTHHEQSKSQGGNIGIGANSLNLGYNQQNSNSDVTTNNTPSGIIYVNADANHGSGHSLSTNHTTLTGGVIAAISEDEQGNQTNSELNFTTNTLTTNDLLATESSQNKGMGLGLGSSDNKPTSISISANNNGHQKETTALATIGQGATITGTITHNGQAQTSTDLTQTDINTDALTTQQVIKDTKTGGLDVNTTIDTRVFTTAGRQEIKKEQEELDENLQATGKITGAAGVQVVATTANVLTDNQTLTQAIQGAKAPAKMAKAIQDNPELAAILDAYQKGEYHNLTLSQEALQALSDATGISTEVLLTSITAQRGIQGGTNKALTVIDTHDKLRQDSIQTLAHELDHIRGGKNETLADLAGLAAKLNTDAAIIANQDTISPIKAQLGDGKDAQTTAQNQALLEGNDKAFAENHDGREGEWEYRQLHKQEKDLAAVLVKLAKKKGLKRPDGKLYTRQDIEDALRWANSGKYGETYNSKRTVHIGNQAPQSAIDKVMYDGGVGKHFESRLWLSSTNGNVTTFTQNLNNIKKPDSDLTKFIQEQAPSYKYSWDRGLVVAYQQPITATQPISPAKKISGSPSQISDRQLRSKDSAVINGGGGVDFSGGANIQAKSEKIINEQVMPVVQTGVGLAEVGTGTAMCASGVGCSVGAALIIHGSDNAVTGNANRGKTSNQQTSSVLLTQGVGLSEGTASNIKMGTDLALGGATAAQGVGRRVASGASGTGTTIGKHTDDTLTKVGDWDLENVSNYGNPNTPADRIIATEKSNHTKELKDLGVEKIGQLPHYDDKHGAYTSLQDQYDRAMTGTNKTLSEKGYPPGKPVNASKFFNSTDMEYAMRQAEKMYAENPKKYIYEKNQVTINFDRPVGEGFIKNNKTTQANGTAGEYRWSNTAIVGIDPKTGKAYTAFPNMDEGYKQENQLLDFIKK